MTGIAHEGTLGTTPATGGDPPALPSAPTASVFEAQVQGAGSLADHAASLLSYSTRLKGAIETLNVMAAPKGAWLVLNDPEAQVKFLELIKEAGSSLGSIKRVTEVYQQEMETHSPSETACGSAAEVAAALDAVGRHAVLSGHLIKEVEKLVTAGPDSSGCFMGQPYKDVKIELVARTCGFLHDSMVIVASGAVLPTGARSEHTSAMEPAPAVSTDVERARVLNSIVAEGLQPAWRLLAQGRMFMGSADELSLHPGNQVGTAWLPVPAPIDDEAGQELVSVLRYRLGCFDDRSPLGVVVESPGLNAEEVLETFGLDEFEARLSSSCMVVLSPPHAVSMPHKLGEQLTQERAWWQGWDGPYSPMFSFLPPEHIKRLIVPKAVYDDVEPLLSPEAKALVTVVDQKPADRYSRPYFLPKEACLSVPAYADAVLELVQEARDSGQRTAFFFHAVRLPKGTLTCE